MTYESRENYIFGQFFSKAFNCGINLLHGFQQIRAFQFNDERDRSRLCCNFYHVVTSFTERIFTRDYTTVDMIVINTVLRTIFNDMLIAFFA